MKFSNVIAKKKMQPTVAELPPSKKGQVMSGQLWNMAGIENALPLQIAQSKTGQLPLTQIAQKASGQSTFDKILQTLSAKSSINQKIRLQTGEFPISQSLSGQFISLVQTKPRPFAQSLSNKSFLLARDSDIKTEEYLHE